MESLEILKSLLAADFTAHGYCRADLREFLRKSGRAVRDCKKWQISTW